MVAVLMKVLRLCAALACCLVICEAQRRKSCPAGSHCVPLRSCPAMLALVQSPTTEENRRLARRAICGFERRSPLVCCESSTGPTPTQKPPGLQLGANGETLLPRFCGRPATEDKIIGGTATPLGAYPWVAAMGYTEPGKKGPAFVCSGSIINSKYVLTAAHCVNPAELGTKRLSVIHLGDWNLTSPGMDCQRTRIGDRCLAPHIAAGYEEIIMHPQYNTRAKASDDIALIRLNVTLNFEEDEATVEPICLPSKNFDVRGFTENRRLVATGWGFTENGRLSDILLSVTVPMTDNQTCKELYPEFIGKQLCVGGEGGQDTCNGDSGGPLILSNRNGPPFTQLGIVSYGVFPCGLQEFPGVYTSVADYRDWIVSTIKP